MKLLLVFLFFTSSAFAQSELWNKRLHLLLGGGGNISNYHRSGDVIGTGLHFKTDVVLPVHDKWAVETGSFVRFNYIHDTFIWDTLLTVGVRRKLKEDQFLRVFAGRAPTVFFTSDTPDVYQRKTSRILYTGPVYGAAWGKFEKTKAGTEWFWELSGHYQSLEKGKGIQDDGEVPEVVFVTGKEKIQIYSVSISFGILVF